MSLLWSLFPAASQTIQPYPNHLVVPRQSLLQLEKSFNWKLPSGDQHVHVVLIVVAVLDVHIVVVVVVVIVVVVIVVVIVVDVVRSVDNGVDHGDSKSQVSHRGHLPRRATCLAGKNLRSYSLRSPFYLSGGICPDLLYF